MISPTQLDRAELLHARLTAIAAVVKATAASNAAKPARPVEADTTLAILAEARVLIAEFGAPSVEPENLGNATYGDLALLLAVSISDLEFFSSRRMKKRYGRWDWVVSEPDKADQLVPARASLSSALG